MNADATGLRGLRACNDALQSCGGAYRVDSVRPAMFQGRICTRHIGPAILADVELAHCIVRRDLRDLESSRAADGYYNLILQCDGHAWMRQCGTATLLSPGELTIIDERFASEFETADAFRQLALTLPAAPIRQLLGSDGVPLAQRIPGSGGAARLLVDLMTSCHRNASSLADVDVIAAVTQLLAASVGRRQAAGRDSATRSPDLSRIARYIDENLDRDELSPAVLARQFAMSVRQLYRLTSTAGCTPSGLIWSRRLERARQLLNEGRSEARVLDVALSCGFKDGAHFSRAFRRAYGRSPRESRQGWCTRGPVMAEAVGA